MQGFFVEKIDSSSVYLEGQEHHHLSRSLRMKPGEKVYITDGKGNYAVGVIRKITKRYSEVELIEKGSKQRGKEIVLAVALIKEDRMELMVEKLTELGVSKIVLFPSARSQKRQISPNKWERLRKAALQALKQSKGAWLPDLLFLSNLNEFFYWSEKYGDRYLLDVGGKALERIPEVKEAVGVVGPEGGFTSEEMESFRSRGFKKLRLSDKILRTETAAICFASLFLHGG